MVSAPKSARFSLADVLPSCLLAVTGQPNVLGLPAVEQAVVLLVDGLGAHSLAARAGHARTLASTLGKTTRASTVFPTTTASALATFATGASPGEHGLVGYRTLDSAHDRVVNQLNGWDERLDPETWQRCRTVFESAFALGVPSFAVGVERYRSTGFTRAVLRGAEYRAGVSIADRLTETRNILDESKNAIVYVYVPELDQTGHSEGWQSAAWTECLEELDAAVRGFLPALRQNAGMLVTADHGMVDVPEHRHILVDNAPGLLDGIRYVAGEPRCLQLHFEPDATTELREAVTERWVAAESSRARVATRAEAVAAGWFGEVDDVVLPRIGDLLVAARAGVAYYDSRDTGSGRSMVGQHGSFASEELTIPLLRFGAFARDR